MSIDQEKMIVEALSSLYPLQEFEEKAIHKVIDALSTAEPKRGRWIPVDAFTAFGGDEATWMAHGNPTAFHYCSVCKGQAYAGEDGESLLTDFCPNCGADMREVTT